MSVTLTFSLHVPAGGGRVDLCPRAGHGRAAVPRQRVPSQRGFTLVEILITVIVLAVGLLGMAGLQVSVIKTVDSARLRTLATQASADLADRVRADPAAILQAFGRTASIAANGCASTPTARWKRDFCAFGLPAPKDASNAVDIRCSDLTTATGCGQGNCEIIVRWNDIRGDVESKSKTLQDAGRVVAFRTCSRMPDL